MLSVLRRNHPFLQLSLKALLAKYKNVLCMRPMGFENEIRGSLVLQREHIQRPKQLKPPGCYTLGALLEI